VHLWLSERGPVWGHIRVPIRSGGIVEVFDEASHLCLELDASVLVDCIALYVRTARVVQQIQDAPRDPLSRERMTLRPRPGTRIELAPAAAAPPPAAPPPPPRKPLAKITPEIRAARRAQRRRPRRKA
jgi:hypothetical protein